jgi:hypothetical protein
MGDEGEAGAVYKLSVEWQRRLPMRGILEAGLEDSESGDQVGRGKRWEKKWGLGEELDQMGNASAMAYCRCQLDWMEEHLECGEEVLLSVSVSVCPEEVGVSGWTWGDLPSVMIVTIQ